MPNIVEDQNTHDLGSAITARVLELRSSGEPRKPAPRRKATRPAAAGLSVKFEQGAAEAVALARVLSLYKSRGIDVSVACAPELEFLFKAAGLACVDATENMPALAVPSPADFQEANVDRYWAYNQAASLIGSELLPDIDQSPEALWPELVASQLDVSAYVQAAIANHVKHYLRDLPRPLILMNPMANTPTANMPRDTIVGVYRQILDQSPGTLLVCDWDNSVPTFGNYRVRNLSTEWAKQSPTLLLALAQAADVVVSVDSPLLHVASLTDVPVVGVFLSPKAYPTRTTLPRSRTVNLVPHDGCHRCNRRTRLAYNLIEMPRGSVSLAATGIAGLCLAVLAGPKFLSEASVGADLQLQQFVMDWECGYENTLSGYVDRHRGYGALFQEIASRFVTPVVVETSTIASEESWRIDGYSTYLLGTFLNRQGGTLISVDPDGKHTDFARSALTELPGVTLVTDDPAVYLHRMDRDIDVLVLTGDDPLQANTAENCLSYLRAAESRLHDRSVVLVDDTPYYRGTFTGRGALALPWLLDRGWRILRSGYQTICVKATE